MRKRSPRATSGRAPAGPDRRARLEALRDTIGRHTPDEGIAPTPVPGLIFYRSSTPRPREPMVFGTSVCVVAAGAKRAYSGGASFTYDPLNYLVLSVPLPVDCEIIRAGAAEPFLSLVLDIVPARVSQLALEIDAGRRPVDAESPAAAGIFTARIDDPLLDAMLRLVALVDQPHHIPVLAPLIEREILYRLLLGDRNGVLRAVGLPDTRAYRLGRLLRHLHANLAEPLDVPALARFAHMSVSTLHQHFRAVTGLAPLQYLKTIRLHQARSLLVHQGLSAKEASRRVGFRSSSQFSRDYRRLFGVPPMADAQAQLARE